MAEGSAAELLRTCASRTEAPGMRVEPLSHRGYWLDSSEKNTEIAFRRALEAGFGIETDIRDRNGRAVIAHDVTDPGTIGLDAFLAIYNEYPARPMLALNIKADGLQALVRAEIERHRIDRYFVFDMSIPDMLGYKASGLRYYTRLSEYEKDPIELGAADGLWLDQFERDWVDMAVVRRFRNMGKNICIVSPELHRREPQRAWLDYRAMARSEGSGTLYLCTDHPSHAREFFS